MSRGELAAVLQRQHATVRAELADVLDVSGTQRSAAFAKVRRLLAVHEALEQEVVHGRPGEPGRAEVTPTTVAQEVAASKALTHLETLDPASEEFVTAYRQLCEDILAHAALEEREELPLLRGDLDPHGRACVRRALALLAADGGSRVDGETFSAMIDDARRQVRGEGPVDAATQP